MIENKHTFRTARSTLFSCTHSLLLYPSLSYSLSDLSWPTLFHFLPWHRSIRSTGAYVLLFSFKRRRWPRDFPRKRGTIFIFLIRAVVYDFEISDYCTDNIIILYFNVFQKQQTFYKYTFLNVIKNRLENYINTSRGAKLIVDLFWTTL